MNKTGLLAVTGLVATGSFLGGCNTMRDVSREAYNGADSVFTTTPQSLGKGSEHPVLVVLTARDQATSNVYVVMPNDAKEAQTGTDAIYYGYVNNADLAATDQKTYEASHFSGTFNKTVAVTVRNALPLPENLANQARKEIANAATVQIAALEQTGPSQPTIYATSERTDFTIQNRLDNPEYRTLKLVYPNSVLNQSAEDTKKQLEALIERLGTKQSLNFEGFNSYSVPAPYLIRARQNERA